MDALYALYGEAKGLRVARKHIQWYCQDQPGLAPFWAAVCTLQDAAQQRAAVTAFWQA